MGEGSGKPEEDAFAEDTAKEDVQEPVSADQKRKELAVKYGIKKEEAKTAPKEPEKALKIPAPEISVGRPEPVEPSKKPGIPIKKILIAILLLAVLAAAAYSAYTILTKPPEVQYQCLDGSFQPSQELCPVQTTTTTTSTTTTTTETTTTTTTTSTTTTLKIACRATIDCIKPQANTTYCNDQVVIRQYVQYTCLHPGLPNAECIARAGDTIPVKTCKASEYCMLGECYPRTCQDHARDYDETKIDCGGPCRSCTPADVTCNNDTDCGKTERISEYHCNNGNPTAQYTHRTCINPGESNSACSSLNTTDIVEKCGRFQVCVEGQGGCYYLGGNCRDCMQNQGETGIDCGGPCKPCATRPVQYDTLVIVIGRNYTYRGYRLWLNNLISSEGNCTNGASLLIRNPDDVPTTKDITTYANANAYGLQIGYINATTSSVLVWLTRT